MGQNLRYTLFGWLVAAALGHVNPAAAQTSCGAVASLATHDRTTTRYSMVAAEEGQISLVLLVGGGGHLNLDANGCPRALKGNSLVRSLPHFNSAGFATALVDAPSDHPGEDGLKGFRLGSKHATDLGIVIADVRRRNKGPVWLVGTSRGTISAVNAAVRLAGSASADGLVLTSAVTSGGKGGKRPWAVQTVFDVRLETIRMPVLVIGHAADNCPRTPPRLMNRIMARTNGAREQIVTVTGGPGSKHTGLEACQGRTPHGFIEQEPVVASGMARFIRGGSY